MRIEPSSVDPTASPRGAARPSWLQARPLWAGLSIITMWLAVLFVGIFGGDFVSSSNANGYATGFTKIPAVIFLLPFVLPATIAVGRRGFTSASDEPRDASEEAPRAREEPPAEPSAFRAKPA